MDLTAFLVPTFTQMLRAADSWLGKAEVRAHELGSDPDDLMALRLAPDMYPLAAQLRFIVFQAQEPLYLLRGVAVPQELNDVRSEGWAANERPGTLAQARGLITEAVDVLGGVADGVLDEGAKRQIALALPNGMIFDMRGDAYARDWSMPQFYFHLTTAYAILRHHGVALGKADYVAHMMNYLRG